MKNKRHVFLWISLFAVATSLGACATASFPAGKPCATATFSVIDGFAGARRGTCTVLSPDHVRLDIRPESSGYINDSPWYAFKIVPSAPGEALITLRYSGGHHRYWPKISGDGLNWYPMDEQYVTASENRKSADIALPLDGSPVWVAAQEIIPPALYRVWAEKLSLSSGYPYTSLGTSTRGQSIDMFDSDPTGKEVLLLVGRQHPPEVSGAFAFLAFTETVLGDSPLAVEFRERFRVIAIPALNPDGIVGGNWRHNVDDTDLNRDWGKFKQPETAAVRDLLKKLDGSDSQLRMFIDFHSTRDNVFYTQFDETQPAGFTTTWLDNAKPRINNYPFETSASPATNPDVAKNYIFARYGIPAITFEVGDETDRNATRKAARVFAEELMRLMLEQSY